MVASNVRRARDRDSRNRIRMTSAAARGDGYRSGPYASGEYRLCEYAGLSERARSGVGAGGGVHD